MIYDYDQVMEQAEIFVNKLLKSKPKAKGVEPDTLVILGFVTLCGCSKVRPSSHFAPPRSYRLPIFQTVAHLGREGRIEETKITSDREFVLRSKQKTSHGATCYLYTEI